MLVESPRSEAGLGGEHVQDLLGSPAELSSWAAGHFGEHVELGELAKGQVDELVGGTAGGGLHLDPA